MLEWVVGWGGSRIEKHSPIVGSASPSLNLKESFDGALLLKLGAPEPNVLLFSTTAVPVEARHGKQVFGRIPLWSGVTASSPLQHTSDLNRDLESFQWTLLAFRFLEPSMADWFSQFFSKLKSFRDENVDSEPFGEKASARNFFFEVLNSRISLNNFNA